MDQIEKTIQRRLTYLGLATIASATFLGPLMLGAAAGIFWGKFARRSQDKDSKQNSEEETSYFLDEEPETEIARKIPHEAAALLDRDNQRIQYNQALFHGASVARTYLERLPSMECLDITAIEIYPEQQLKVLGIPLGRKSLEVKIRRE
jgi:hypothetical protein